MFDGTIKLPFTLTVEALENMFPCTKGRWVLKTDMPFIDAKDIKPIDLNIDIEKYRFEFPINNNPNAFKID